MNDSECALVHCRLQWMPKLEVSSPGSGSKSQQLIESAFLFNDTLPWFDPSVKPAYYADLDECPHCASYLAEENIEIKLSAGAFGSYASYPFDEHDFVHQPHRAHKDAVHVSARASGR